MEKIDIWFLIVDCGDGSAYLEWYLTESDTEKADQKQIDECEHNFAELCNGRVETFVGSNIHKDAIENSTRLNKP